MSTRLPGHGRSSAAARLVARAARPAVRAYGENRISVSEVDQREVLARPRPPAADPAAAPAPPVFGRAEPMTVPIRSEATSAPPVSFAIAPASSALAQSPPSEPEAEPPQTPRVEPDDVPPPATAPDARREEASVPGDLPTWTLVEAPVPEARTRQAAEPSAPQEAPGWQSLARPQASDERLATRADPQGAVAAAARGRAPTPASPSDAAAPPLQLPAAAPPVVSATSHGHALAAAPSARPPAPPAAPPPAQPQVLIDRIEVITPPARPLAPDPFLSLAERRVGASRHGGRS
jgi:hypothetical protein